jgi:hypothetical protein
MDILRLTAKFRMVTQDALHARHFILNKRDAVKSTLRRLCGDGPQGFLLKSEPLDARRVYYRLTTRATRLLGVSDDLARPLGLQARIRRYAILWFMCIDDSAERQPFKLQDFPEYFPVARHRLPRSHFYLEELSGEVTRLGFSVIDTGRHRQRLFRSAATSLNRFLDRGWLDDFISSGCFELTVLTLTEPGRKAIELELPRYLRRVLGARLKRLAVAHNVPLPFSIRVCVVPGLINVIPDSVSKKG